MVALGCASQQNLVSYDVGLTQVESPANAKVQYGETKIISFTETGDKNESITKYSYEDDYITIVWYVTYSQFNFTLINKTNYTIKINWDDISYVDYKGQTGRVMHAGIKYTDRNNSQPHSLIPRGASLKDMLLPTENVYFSQNIGWREYSLIPNSISDPSKIDIIASQYVGKTLSILMPIYIENVQNDYMFTFNINSYKSLK